MAKGYPAVSVSAPRPEKRQKGGTAIESINISKADNGGFILRCEHERKAAKNGESNYVEPTTNVAATLEQVEEYIRTAFGGKKDKD